MALANPAAGLPGLTVVRLPPPLRPLFPYLKPAYVRATGVVAPATRRLSTHDGLPTATITTLADIAPSEGRVRQARPPETLPRPPMRGWPDATPLSDIHRDTLPVVSAAELVEGRVLGPHRAVITNGNRLVDEVSRYFGTTRAAQHPIFWNPRPDSPTRVDGRLGVIACRVDANYYHLLLDALPRIALVEQAGLAPPERWYAPARLGFQRELLELLGLADGLVDADAVPHVVSDELVVTDLPAHGDNKPPWVVQFLRDRLLPAVDVAPGPDLFLTRGPSPNNRSVRNEPDVRAALLERGFIAIDPGTLSVREQISAFAGARRIVGAHGAALTNIVFASPGAALIELFPAGCLLPDFARLADATPGVAYRFLSAPGGPRRPTRNKTITRDMDVNMSHLLRVLDELD